MHVRLDAESERFIAEQIEAGHYSSVDELVSTALACFRNRTYTGDFDTNELDRLIAQAEESGELIDGEHVFAELKSLRHAGPSKP